MIKFIYFLLYSLSLTVAIKSIQVSFLNLNCWMSSERGANYFSSTNLNSSIKKIKCLKQVFKWYSSPRAIIIWKWV